MTGPNLILYNRIIGSNFTAPYAYFDKTSLFTEAQSPRKPYTTLKLIK